MSVRASVPVLGSEVARTFSGGHGFKGGLLASTSDLGLSETAKPTNSAVKGFVAVLIAETPMSSRLLSFTVNGGNGVQWTPLELKAA